MTTDALTGRLELPFWLLYADGTRTTLRVRHYDKFRLVLYNDAAALDGIDTTDFSKAAEQVQQILGHCHCQLRPKAVTLTLFVRLFLADWFIHGIGGARYEYITDCLIRTFFGIDGLAFGVATMTAVPPLVDSAAMDLSTRSMPSGQLRILKHNPEKLISLTIRQTEPTKSLIERKATLTNIASDPALAVKKRKKARNLIAKLNKKLLEVVQNNEKTASVLRNNDKIGNPGRNFREYFFGLFDKSTLNEILNAPMFPTGTQ